MDISSLAHDASMRECSVGIMAHNEARNIATAVTSILTQQTADWSIRELVVVASGCTDDTVPIIMELAREDARIRLIIQERREGKASAINEFMRSARAPVLVMAGADVVVKPGSLTLLLQHFDDPAVGMVGAHPVPVNDDDTFLGHAVHLVWQIHDQIARRAAKLGEVVAFRSVLPGIPVDTAVDEISIQALISQLGYRLLYEPRAIVYNRGPTTIADFLRQRRRIYAGHLRIRDQQGYEASTMRLTRVARALIPSLPLGSPRALSWTAGAIALELTARVLGAYDYARRRPMHVWQMVNSTKVAIAEGAQKPTRQSVLVLRIVDFHEHELELGSRVSRALMQQIAQRMRAALGPDATISPTSSGTIVAVVACDREEAEQAAQRLIDTIEGTPLRWAPRAEGIAVRLTCGIITFLQTGQAVALSVPGHALPLVTMERKAPATQ